MPVYKNKKTNLWKYRVYADDVYGVRRQFEKGGFKTKKDAINAENEFLVLEKSKECDITFEELYCNYKNYIRIKQKRQSYRKTISKFENHILPYFKNYKVRFIDAKVYTKWQSEIEQKGFKHRTNSSLHGSMVTILNYAIKFHGLKENIASKIGNFKRKGDLIRKVDFWTLDEYKSFIKVVDDIVYKTFFETLYYTGLRQGEALALTWNDLKDNYLDIHKTISKEKENGNYIINTPKTSKSIRIIKLNKKLVANLNELKKYYQNTIEFSNGWYIFGGIVPLAPSTIGRRKDKYCEKANVKKIRIHDFRHSHASLLLSNGTPITVISERLGHADINMTLNTYSHLIPKDEDKAVEIIDKIISKNT